MVSKGSSPEVPTSQSRSQASCEHSCQIHIVGGFSLKVMLILFSFGRWSCWWTNEWSSSVALGHRGLCDGKVSNGKENDGSASYSMCSGVLFLLLGCRNFSFFFFFELNLFEWFHRSFRSSKLITLNRPAVTSSNTIMNWSFRYSAHILWNSWPAELRCSNDSGSPGTNLLSKSTFLSKLKTNIFHNFSLSNQTGF